MSDESGKREPTTLDELIETGVVDEGDLAELDDVLVPVADEEEEEGRQRGGGSTAGGAKAV